MEDFYNRFEERKILCQKNNASFINQLLIVGEYGIGKKSLLKDVYKNQKYLWCNGSFNDYFNYFLMEFIKIGFHNYLMNQAECSYKDLYYKLHGERILQNDSILDLLLSNKFFCGKNEVSIETLIAGFILSIGNYDIFIFDNFENCDDKSYGKIMNMFSILSTNNLGKQYTVIYILPETYGKRFDLLNSISNHTIILQGLALKYIEALVMKYFDNPDLNYKDIAEYLFHKYNGNPGAIINLLKLKFNTISNLTQNEAYIKITTSQNIGLDPTEKRIVLFLAVLPFPLTIKRITKFLFNDRDYPNIDSQETIEEKFLSLKKRKIIQVNGETIHLDKALKKLYKNMSQSEEISVHTIFKLQKNFDKSMNSREKSDCLDYVINSGLINCNVSMRKRFYNFTISTAISMANCHMWKESVEYFNKVKQYSDLLTEGNYAIMFESIYYNGDFSDIKDYLISINDEAFNSFAYWFWKGNLLYMINSTLSVDVLDKAVNLASCDGERLKAQIFRKQAMSELPNTCSETLNYYNNLLEEYKDADFKELAMLYRNSLVVGGERTIVLCDKGMAIADKYNQKEEMIKLNHNKHFELFRMGRYDGCYEAFEESAKFFQITNTRVYESSYGYNNLALICLVNKMYSNAKLYAYSALIYADTPYSQIATHVNHNLIASFCDNDLNEQKSRINKIEQLLEYYEIKDCRMFRKTYFSIAISYININQSQKAREYLLKSKPYLQTGRHINRYLNLCEKLNITPDGEFVYEVIDENNEYYNFYANPEFELWLLAYGHL